MDLQDLPTNHNYTDCRQSKSWSHRQSPDGYGIRTLCSPVSALCCLCTQAFSELNSLWRLPLHGEDIQFLSLTLTLRHSCLPKILKVIFFFFFFSKGHFHLDDSLMSQNHHVLCKNLLYLRCYTLPIPLCYPLGKALLILASLFLYLPPKPHYWHFPSFGLVSELSMC